MVQDVPYWNVSKLWKYHCQNIQITNMGSGTYRVSADIVNSHAAARSPAALNIAYDDVALNNTAVENILLAADPADVNQTDCRC